VRFPLSVSVASVALAAVGWPLFARCRHNAAHVPSDCIAVNGISDFCVAPGCTLTRHNQNFVMTCPNGLEMHTAS
jgi:hypothetical protein